MKIPSALLSRRIREVKSIVPAKSPIPALQSLLIKNEYLIASNNDLSVMVKLEGMTDISESFLLPPKAYNLLPSFSGGDTSITCDANYRLSITNGASKAAVMSQNPVEYSFDIYPGNTETANAVIEAGTLKSAIGCCMFAVADKDSRPVLNSVHFDASEGYLNVVGIDDHLIVWNRIKYDGSMKLLLPYKAAKTLLSLDIKEPVTITSQGNKVKFVSGDYIMQARLSDGSVMEYAKMFSEMPLHTSIDKSDLIRILTRIKTLIQNELDRKPAKFQFDGDIVHISFNSSTAAYQESIELNESIEQPITIAFNPDFLLEVLKAYPGDSVNLNLSNSKAPMLISADDCELRSMILPVNIGN